MIVILGILAGIVVFAVGNLTSNAKTNACSTEKSHDRRGGRGVQGAERFLPGDMTALTSGPGALLK